VVIESARALEDQKSLPVVQYLRGIAAVMVVVSHCYLYASKTSPGLAALPWMPAYGFFGVAIFFVISGFIMYFTSRDRWSGSAEEAKGFALRRLHRIVPLYWLVTAITIAMILVAGADDAHVKLSWREVVQSLLFFPYGFNGINFRPIVGVGWTLDFEMFFYALFATGLLLPRRLGLPLVLGLIVATIAIGATGALGRSPAAAFAQPIVGLFGVGILLGWAHEQLQFRLSYWRGSALLYVFLLVSPIVLAAAPRIESQLWFNPVLWSYATVCVVVGVFTAAPRRMSAAERFGLLLGGASYLLYLIHPLVIRILAEVAQRAGFGSPGGTAAVACAMFGAALVAALVGHRWGELPLNRWAKPLFGLGGRLQRA